MSVKIKRVTVGCPQNQRSHPTAPLGPPPDRRACQPTLTLFPFSKLLQTLMDPDPPGMCLWLPRLSCSVFKLERALRAPRTARQSWVTQGSSQWEKVAHSGIQTLDPGCGRPPRDLCGPRSLTWFKPGQCLAHRVLEILVLTVFCG